MGDTAGGRDQPRNTGQKVDTRHGTQQRPPSTQIPYHHGQAVPHVFAMDSLGKALPTPGGHIPMQPPPFYAPSPAAIMMSAGMPYRHGQLSQYSMPPGQAFDHVSPAIDRQQGYMTAQLGQTVTYGPPLQGQFPSMHVQTHYGPPNFQSQTFNSAQYSPRDLQMRHQSLPAMGQRATQNEPEPRGQGSSTIPVPLYPRGPPRKPRQSGYALWVGNLPPAAKVVDLKDHFSRDATSDIESIFLISKSNCAFVNYKTEAACFAAMNRFHDSRFQGVRLVCRLRRGSAPVVSGVSSSEFPEVAMIDEAVAEEDDAAAARGRSREPTIVQSNRPSSPIQQAEATARSIPPKVPEKYFIVKSLTVQDLQASVRNGTWATQPQNEAVLHNAWEEAENVFLLFSANKTGEYFGYARMTSGVTGNTVKIISNQMESEPQQSGGPQSIPTPATATAPRGRIVDDSARGTIFWEIEDAEQEEETEGKKSSSTKDSQDTQDQSWGKQFSIEWVSTNRVPFYRTRGLRNPMNANREVKIARDGQELDPGIGRRLIQMFH